MTWKHWVYKLHGAHHEKRCGWGEGRPESTDPLFSPSKRLLLRFFALLAESGQDVQLDYLDFPHDFVACRFSQRQCAKLWFPA